MSFAPTSEQNVALDIFKTGASFAIQAGAGTGKTATLKLLAESTSRRGQYIAFNKAIVDESREKFPSNVNCSTAHSLAYRAIAAGTPFEARMRSGKRMRSIDIANRLGVDALRIKMDDGENKTLSSSFLAGLALSTVTRFCQSADAEITFRHVPRVPGLDADEEWTINRIVAKHVEPYAKKAWADLINHNGTLPFTRSTAMNVFLKLWQLSKPRIGADFILFDEAQDANPVMVAVVSAQRHAQLVWVGDSQQQIYAFTGAVNALDTVPADHRCYLTQSFRFGPAVAEIANQVLSLIASAEIRLVGYDKIASVVAPIAEPDVVLTRTNAEAVRTVLGAIADEKTFHLVGGGKDVISFCQAAQDLQNGIRTDHPELAPFESWDEVQTYVDEDEQGSDLKLLVKLIDEFTAAKIIGALSTQAKEDEAELVVSTAHKSKGRQWGSVQIAGDFDEERILKSDDEKRLLYVAVTRAQFELDVDAIPFLRNGYIPTIGEITVTSGDEKAPTKPQELVSRDEDAPARVEVISGGNEHYGVAGARVDLELTVSRVNPTPTRYGGYLTILTGPDGHMFKWFSDELLEQGDRVAGTWSIKSHDEFNGQKETMLNRPAGVEVVA